MISAAIQPLARDSDSLARRAVTKDEPDKQHTSF